VQDRFGNDTIVSGAAGANIVIDSTDSGFHRV